MHADSLGVFGLMVRLPLVAKWLLGIFVIASPEYRRRALLHVLARRG